MNKNQSVIVPFGKYKGKPVEAMAQDRDYCEWLQAQDWFRTKYANFNTLIINNFGEPTETPEHNALQAMFTDEAFCERFAALFVKPEETPGKIAAELAEAEEKYPLELKRLNALNDDYIARCGGTGATRYIQEIKEATANIEFLRHRQPIFVVELVGFEINGADLDLIARTNFAYCRLRIECKPSVGDDYPAILREMNSSKSNVLFIGAGGYTGQGATLDQVRRIFGGIRIVLLSDLSA